MYLGIEIGGTKLQLGVGTGQGAEFVDFRRLDVRPELGAAGIRQQIADAAMQLIQRHEVKQIGIGFGGPVDSQSGLTIKSHQIEGWDQFPLVSWCEKILGVRAVLGNDCDVATLAEARFGAGRGCRGVFFITVGTGVGGGCVIDGQLLGRGRPAIAEIGHLRPGLDATDARATVESLASGWGIATAVRRLASEIAATDSRDRDDLLQRCSGDLAQLTSIMITDAARSGNRLAQQGLDGACRALGWAIAQVVTLLAPEIVVIGGGVSLMGEEYFFQPVRKYVATYVFPPLRNSYDVIPAGLGEQVVVVGAVALAGELRVES